jgi:transcriptional regulator with XRE-family HTH domain
MTMKEWLDNKFAEWRGADRTKTIQDFSIYLGVEYGALEHWMSGRRKPRRENVDKLAERLGLEAYDIAGFARPDGNDADPLKHRLMTILDSLNDDGKQRLAHYAESLLNSNQPDVDRSNVGAET